MACAGDVPTLETLAAVSMLRAALPSLRIRVVNVVDLMRLQPASEHPHGLSDAEFDAIFTDGHAGDLRLPRVSVADPPPHVPPHESRQHSRPRLQGGRHDDDAVRHGDAQRSRSLPPRDGRDRPCSAARRSRGGRPPGDGRRARRGAAPHARDRCRSSGGHRTGPGRRRPEFRGRAHAPVRSRRSNKAMETVAASTGNREHGQGRAGPERVDGHEPDVLERRELERPGGGVQQLA